MATVAGTVRLAPGDAATVSTATSHTPAPPPVSARVTRAGAVAPALTSPNETETGEATTSGTSAFNGSASPPPPLVGGAGCPSTSTAVPVSTRAALIIATDQSGCLSRRSAAAPEIWGVAMDVPDIAAHSFPGTDERIETPGALMSGFSRSDRAEGPELLNPARLARPELGFVTAATVMARSDVPGEESEPRPKSS